MRVSVLDDGNSISTYTRVGSADGPHEVRIGGPLGQQVVPAGV
jgi:hypothetical protein